jgi:hypothetical protein
MAADILTRLKAGRDALGSVTVNGVDLGLRLLTDQDYQLAGLAADSLLVQNDTELTLSNSDVFEAEKSLQLIALAVVDPKTKKPVFATPDEARGTFTRDDKKLIIEKYLEHERKFSPSGLNLTEAEFAEVLGEVKKNPQTPRLNDLSGDSLRRLIATLVSQPST